MQYTTYLRWGVITGLFAVLFVPFIVADGGNGGGIYIPWVNYFFPYITGKAFVFRIIIEITLALYLILCLRDPKYRPRASYIMWALLALVAWMAVATIASVDPIKSFWSNFERMEGYVGLLHLFAYFVIVGAMLSAQNLWDRFFNTSIGASVVMGLFALLQALELFGLHPSSQSGARADTTFGNAAYLGVYMLFSVFITLYMLARTSGRNTLMQSVYGIALVLQFAGLYFTQTRGALLGVVGGLIIAMIWIAWRAGAPQWRSLRNWSLGGLVALVVLAGAFFAFRDTLKKQPNVVGRLASISLEEKTTRSRLFSIWPMAVQGAMERPIAGWGQENFSYVFNAHYNPSMWDQEQWFDRAHNQFLDWLVAGGVPAFLLYVSLFVLAVWAIIRSALSVPEQAVLLGALAAVAFNNMFVFDNLISSVYFLTILALAHGLSKRELPGALWLSRPLGDQGVAIAAPVIAIVVLGGAWAFNGPGMVRAHTLVSTLAVANDPAASYAGMQASLSAPWPGTGLGYQEVVEQLVNYSSGSIASASVPEETKQNFYALSQDALAALAAQRKDDARLHLFASGLHAQFGNIPSAVAQAQRALELSPGKQQMLSHLGLLYLNSGEEQKALEVFKQSYDSAPENDDALILYAAGQFYLARISEGDKILTDRFGTVLVDNARLLQMYASLKMWDRVIGIRQLQLDKNPNDFDLNFALANAYFAAGRKEDTIAQLEKMKQIDPSKAGQIQTLIDQLSVF